jgi:uncharacterized membrane protein YfcA
MAAGLLMIAGGVAAGAFGSLLGLGGGLLIVPLLSVGFGLPLREAIGVSLVSVIVTSGAAAGVYLERRVANLRLGMTLELFTAAGAIAGGVLAFALEERVIAALFAVMLVYTAVSMIRRRPPEPDLAAAAPVGEPTAGWTESLHGPGYRVGSLAAGSLASVGAGVVSALLGVGGGIVKVPVMHLVMGVPLRVATATSNLMIGVTASAGAIIYLLHGEIEPSVAAPTALGVFAGATIGSRSAHRVDVRLLRILFVVVLLVTALEMMRRAIAGGR